MVYFGFVTSSGYIPRIVKYKRLKKHLKEQLKKNMSLFYTGNEDLINRYNSTESGEVSPLPAPQICNKRCSKRHVMRRFCVSDFGECWFISPLFNINIYIITKFNARALIGQSAMVYCASKPIENSRVLQIII